jgi:hypothetical protein
VNKTVYTKYNMPIKATPGGLLFIIEKGEGSGLMSTLEGSVGAANQ